MRFMLALLMGFALAAPATAAPIAWVQAWGHRQEVRVVVDAAAPCPVLRVNRNRPLRTTERAGPTEAFPNRLCAAIVGGPANRRLRLDGRALPLLRPRPNRIVILGDSGCRIVKVLVQNCNDPVAGWPFAKVAALAARQRPDLVIHVGDYYYRESPCPPLIAACAGSPYGDRWATWKAELFDPAAPLLAAAPWVFLRGNHEDCARGGTGWFRLLDYALQPKTCPAHSDPFTVELGGLRLAVLDSADPDDNRTEPDQAAIFARDIAALPKSGEPTWLVTHRPFWALSHHLLEIGGDWGNVNMREAAKEAGLAGASLIVAGHVHNFTSLDFGEARPPELIVGTGGDYMDPRDPHRPLQLTLPVDGVKTQAITTGEFGYFVFERAGRDWVGAFHELDDKVTVRCRLHAAHLSCAPAA